MNSLNEITPASSTGRKDEALWEVAKQRANFKRTLISYVFVNLLLVAIWFFTSGNRSYFWPIWPILGWGIGLLFQYLAAYHSNAIFSTEREYEKLKSR